jgi:hypothetical protein
MTDLSPTATATATCPVCGAQNATGARRCTDCGSTLDVVGAESERDVLELDEAWRAAGAGGYDTELAFADGTVTCSNCGGSFGLGEANGVSRQPARDTPTNRDGLVVLTMACPRCGHLGRAEAAVDEVEAADADGGRSFGIAAPPDDVDASEVDHRAPAAAGATPETPLGDDRRFFDEGGPGSLAERGSLLDEQGEDIRQYTGEPVETDEGWVVPVQQNVGPDNMAGGGEFPDPNSPSAMPSDDDPDQGRSGPDHR